MFPLTNQARCCMLVAKPIFSMTVRNFSPKEIPTDDGTYRGQVPRRWGYEAHHHTKGALPRLSIREKRLATLPITIKEDEWSIRKARMGENDFVRIFKDENIQQHELLDHIPDWLRGYPAKKEYSVLMRKRKEFSYWKYTKPLKWLHLEQRIKFLYRRINNKYEPPDVEKLHKSRHKI